MRMDNSKLIGFVYQRKQLWDVGDHNYHNRDLSRKLWNEIAGEMQCTSHVAKSKWQNLRDTYRKEYMKLLRTGDDSKGSHWKYFDKLKFLDDVIVLRKNTSGRRNDDEKTIVDGFEEYTEFTDITPLRYLCEMPQAVEGEADNEKRRSPELTSSNVRVDAVRTHEWNDPPKDRRFNADANHLDEDYHFVMSILPHLQDVPKRRKLIVRQRLQQILLEEQTAQSVHRNTAATACPVKSEMESEFTQHQLNCFGGTDNNTKETNVEDK